MKINCQRQAKSLFNKASVLILTISCLLGTGSAFAQTVPVTLKLSSVPLEVALDKIEAQTNYLFVYEDEADLTKTISIDAVNTPLKNVLDELFRGTNIAYKVVNTSIVLTVNTNPASEPKTITGTVKDAKGDPIIGASIIVDGTTTGTTADISGNFSLNVPAGKNRLMVSYLGMEPQIVTIGKQTHLNIVLQDSSVAMNTVVVTALGIKRSEKALSYNVQQVNSDDIATNKDANFINALNGKVAGLTINSSSSGVGGSSRVIMRGTKSISQSSNALYVVDGVPVFVAAKEGDTEFGSQGTTDPIADINPEDIASISVLNGAAAAALYGSDAANGAIVVTTKKGQAGKTVLTVTSNLEVMTPFVLPKFQNRYGMGDLNSSAGSMVRSWGQKLNSSNYTKFDPADDYFRTGVIGTESVSLSTGTEKNQTYLSAAAVNSQGIVPNNKYDRYNFTFRNTSNFLNDKMTLNLGASYVIQKDRNMINQGTYNNPLLGAYIFPRGNDWSDIKIYERYDTQRKLYTQYWPFGDAGMTMQNPYWSNYRNVRENDKNRYMLDASLSYDILSWLNVAGRIRIDNSENDYTEKIYASSNTQLTELSRNGLYGTTKSKDKQVYGDVLVNINKNFGTDWSLQANLGASITDLRYDEMLVRGPIPDGVITDEKPLLANVFNIQNLSNTPVTQRKQDGWREQVQSIFASAEVGFKNAYYLTLTARNDWPSALAGPYSNKSSFFYPSVGLSVVLSEIIPNMPEELSYLKLRSSYASVGVPFKRYIANPLYAWNGSSWNIHTVYPLYNLKPERTDSFEIGFTMRFLKNFNLDFTYYNTKTKNQTFYTVVSTGTGSSTFPAQSGNIRNRGIELALGYNNKWRNFSWSSNYTLSVNRNKILKLGRKIYNPETNEYFSIKQLDMNGLGEAHFLLREGGTMGDLYSLIDLKRDNTGAIYMDEKGNIATEQIKNSDNYIKLGSVLPDANMSWRNDFKLGDFNFGFMVTARLGGIVFSRTQAILDYYGTSKASADARDAGGVVINGGDLVNANKWYTAIGGGTSIPQYYTYSATNIRLQEASIGYTIPRRKLRDVCEITVSLVGRNLWMIYNKAPFDPEVTATTGNYYQGIDYFMMPSLRNIGFNLRFKF